MEGCSEEELADKQKLLNTKYDAFVKQYGAITFKANRIAFRDDSDYPLLCSLEDVNEDGEVKKADMFYKQTIKAKAVIDRVETAVEALNVSVGEFGYVNIPYMLSIYEPDITKAMEELAEKSGNSTEGVSLSDDATTELCLLQIFHFPQNYPAPGMNNPRISIPQGGFKGLATCGIIGKDVQKEAMYGVNLYSGALVQKDHLRYCGKYPRMGQRCR